MARRVAVGVVTFGVLGGLGQPRLGVAGAVPTAGGAQTTTLPIQSSTPLGSAQGNQRTGFPPEPGSREAEAAMQEKQAKLRNDERQRRLVADTDKLLALATQLHTDVQKTDKNILSVDVVRRAEEIEKLARGVKERMRS